MLRNVAIGIGVLLGVFVVVLMLLVILSAALQPKPPYTSPSRQVDPSPSPPGPSEAAPSASPPTGPAPTWTTKPPDPSAEGSNGLALQNVGYYQGRGRAVSFIGEVLNERKEGVGYVEVRITLYDGQGKPLSSERGYVRPNVIEPGQRGVWLIFFADGPPDDWQRTQIVATSTSRDDNVKQTSYPDLEAERVELIPPPVRYGTPEVRAGVVNTGKESAELVQASVALYDAEGRLVDVALLYHDERYGYDKTLSPGETMAFRGDLQRPGLEVGRKDYEVAMYADGQKAQK